MQAPQFARNCSHLSRNINNFSLFRRELTFSGVLISANGKRAKNRDEKRDGQREQLRPQLRLVICVTVYQNATHSLRRHYYTSVQFIASNNCAATTNIPVASNRAIRYSGRTYGNVYRRSRLRSRIVNNNLRQCNHTRYY